MMRQSLALITGLCLLAGHAIAGEAGDPRLARLESVKSVSEARTAAARRDPMAKRVQQIGRLSPRGRMTTLLIFLGSTSGGGALGLLAK